MTDSCPAGLPSTLRHVSACLPPSAPLRKVTHHRSNRSGPRWAGSILANSGRISASTGSSGTCRATAPLTVCSLTRGHLKADVNVVFGLVEAAHPGEARVCDVFGLVLIVGI